MLLQAMQIVWQQLPETRLLIAGARTRFSASLQRQIEALPAEQRRQVLVIDDFAEEDKPRIFAACDVLAYPSEFESFGLAYVEAWACGKPVIGCRVGAVPAVVDDGVDGLLVPRRDPNALASALLRLLEDETLRRQLGEQGRAKVQTNYTWDIVIARFRQVYEQTVDRAADLSP